MAARGQARLGRPSRYRPASRVERGIIGERVWAAVLQCLPTVPAKKNVVAHLAAEMTGAVNLSLRPSKHAWRAGCSIEMQQLDRDRTQVLLLGTCCSGDRLKLIRTSMIRQVIRQYPAGGRAV